MKFDRLGLTIESVGLRCCLLIIWFLCGCQTLSLPRIDPTGNRIFAPGSTTLINPHDPNNGYPSTAPAFRDPPTPPKCLGGDKCPGCLNCKGKLGAKARAEEERGRCGELLLTPTQLIAPVRGEVILLAGVCGKDGLLVTNEKIEWMLSPESVGQFVEVGDDLKGQPTSFWRKSYEPKVEKLGVDFARGRTSREAGLITKGTSDPSDDLPLRKGQTWISLTSPSEGTSKVTVLAPDSDIWDKRRQTATIYWVDASWDFPQPEIKVDGSPAVLVTKVMIRDRQAPATGWKVRYRSLDPKFAQFTTGNSTSVAYSDLIEVNVDGNGIAGATLVRGSLNAANAATPKNGTVMVEVEIIRPRTGDLPEIPIAKTVTSVTWSAPNLIQSVVGPEVAGVGENLPYVIRVANNGDLVAENVEVILRLPSGVRVDYSFQPQQQTDNGAIWRNFGPIHPRNVFEVVANVTPLSEMQGSIEVDVLMGGVKQTETSIKRILVESPKLALKFAPRQNITDIPVNGQVVFDGILENVGSQIVNNVRVEIRAEPGLVHDLSGQSNVSTSYPIIRPGEQIRFDAVYRVVREGDHRVSAIAWVQGQSLASQTIGVRGIAPQPAPMPSGQSPIRLDMSAQPDLAQINAGSRVTIRMIVTNPSSSILAKPVLAMEYDPGFQAQNFDPQAEHNPNNRLIRWQINDMRPNQSLEFIAIFVARAPSPAASITAEASGSGLNVRDTKRITFNILNAGNPAGNAPRVPSDSVLPDSSSGLPLPGTSGALRSNRPALGPNAVESERLNLTIQPMGDIVRKGDTMTYEVRVENPTTQPDQKVGMQFILPKGMRMVSVRALALDHKISEDGRIIEFTPIQFFRPRDSFVYTVQIRHEESGPQIFTAAARSLGQPDPVFTKHTTNVQ